MPLPEGHLVSIDADLVNGQFQLQDQAGRVLLIDSNNNLYLGCHSYIGNKKSHNYQLATLHFVGNPLQEPCSAYIRNEGTNRYLFGYETLSTCELSNNGKSGSLVLVKLVREQIYFTLEFYLASGKQVWLYDAQMDKGQEPTQLVFGPQPKHEGTDESKQEFQFSFDLKPTYKILLTPPQNKGNDNSDFEATAEYFNSDEKPITLSDFQGLNPGDIVQVEVTQFGEFALTETCLAEAFIGLSLMAFVDDINDPQDQILYETPFFEEAILQETIASGVNSYSKVGLLSGISRASLQDDYPNPIFFTNAVSFNETIIREPIHTIRSKGAFDVLTLTSKWRMVYQPNQAALALLSKSISNQVTLFSVFGDPCKKKTKIVVKDKN